LSVTFVLKTINLYLKSHYTPPAAETGGNKDIALN